MSKRKYFGTDGVRGRVGGTVINAEFALRLGYAAGKVLVEQYPHRERPAVLIGKDTRISGYMLESALEAGLSAAGIDVLLAGPIPTPAVAYLTRALRLVAGIVVSASHNPFEDNGIKFFSTQGTKLPDDMEARIESVIDQPLGCVDALSLGRARRMSDAAGRYIEFCKSTFPNDLDLLGLNIVVDAAHGAAYHIVPHVFAELGADVHAIGCEPDGFNINDGVGATSPDALIQEVVSRKADLGIALDGDADRLQLVDSTGRLFNGDELLYAIVRDRMLTETVSGVVGTLMTNLGLEHRLGMLNVPFERTAVGDRYVLERLQANNWLYGGEGSGHLLCLDKHTTGDGIVAALQVLTAMKHQGKSVAELVSDLSMYPQIMVNVPWEKGADWRQSEALVSASKAVEQALGNRGRVLIRASGTEPILRLMVEAQEARLAEQSIDTLRAAFN
ncbi:MAG TPA: phosphoglucosamine mutase [Burkholderiaceae bacterium]|nr:phosphoglucosamine mutase [Burkholderiaceae bacterium]